MTDILTSTAESSQRLDEDLLRAKDSLRSIDEGLKSLIGRSGDNNRFGRGGGSRGGGPARLFNKARNESFEGRGNPAAGLAGSKRRLSSFGDWDNNNVQGNGGDWNSKRSRLSLDNHQGLQNAVYHDSFEDDYNRGPKPVLASSVIVTHRDAKTRDDAIAEIKNTEKRDVSVRNRRMFGVLMGTLQKFKKDEDTKHYKEQEKRQKEVEQKLEENKRREYLDLQKEKQKLLEKRKRQEAELRRLQKKKALISATENQMSQLKRLQNFIQTNTKPPIFYMPTKHTIRTIELQKKSQKRLEELIKQKQEEMDEELKFIDSLIVKSDDEDEGAEPSRRSRDEPSSLSVNVVFKKKSDELEEGEVNSSFDLHNSDLETTEGGDSEKNAKRQHSSQQQDEPKTIQDELNELTNAAATNYELHFEEDDRQPV